MTLSRPRILRKVSCCPAKEASGKSSAVALERTATETLSSPPVNSSYAWATSDWSCFGRGVASIQPRISAPAPERLYVVGVEPLEPRFDAGSECAPIEELPESVGRGGETVGDPDSRLGELTDHLAQRCVFPSDLLDVSHSEPIEIHHVFEPSHGSGPSPRLKDHLETVMLQAAHLPRSQNTPPGLSSCPTAAEPSSSSPTAPESRSRCSATAC